MEVIVLDDPRDEFERLCFQASKKRSKHSKYGKYWRDLGLDNKPWGKWSGAAFFTLVIHAFITSSLLLGTEGKTPKRPLTEGFQAASDNPTGTEFVSVMVFVNDKSITLPEEQDPSDYATTSEPQATPQQSAAFVSSSNVGESAEVSLEEIDESATEAQDAVGDGGEAAMLFGRYMDLIKARIERAWEIEPAVRTSKCKVQIRQSKKGEVEEITLVRCTMNEIQQASLVQAIQAASPLSAPPSEKVFTEVVTLTFTTPSPSDFPNTNNRALTHAQLSY
jgi:hypothetical protein